MDPISAVKRDAHLLRRVPTQCFNLSHGQALEVVVSLLTRTRSWNEFSAHPCNTVIPTTVADYIAALCRARGRLGELFALENTTALECSRAAIQYLDTLVDSTSADRVLWRLLDAERVVSFGQYWNAIGGFMAPAPDHPERDSLIAARVRIWLSDHRRRREPWRTTEKSAIEMGWDESQAHELTQRQQSTLLGGASGLADFVAVGVLDEDPCDFLHELKRRSVHIQTPVSGVSRAATFALQPRQITAVPSEHVVANVGSLSNHNLHANSATAPSSQSGLPELKKQLSTGLASLDRAIGGGLTDSDLIIIAGRPNSGKSELLRHIVGNVALQQNVAAGVFIPVETAEAWRARLLSSVTGISQATVLRRKLSDPQRQQIAALKPKIATSIWLDETPGLTIDELILRATRMRNEWGVGLIAIDYLHLIREALDRENFIDYDDTTVFAGILERLKAFARAHRVPVIALSPLKRSLEKRSDKRPVLTDLAQTISSDALDQVDVALLMYREELYDLESSVKGCADIIVGQLRNGPTGQVRVRFQEQRFVDAAE